MSPRDPGRRAWLRRLGGLYAGLLAGPGTARAADCRWPRWQTFKAHYIQADGRVIDYSHDKLHSTSESQAYALFFALVADDRPTFDRILAWTRDNLAGGDLTARLPAWQWGRQANNGWGVLDRNSASDADLWLAYGLLEAGRLWGAPAYAEQGRALAGLILAQEVVDIPGLGRSLLPGPQGFQPAPDRWRLNPSYLPIQVLRLLAARLPEQPWNAVLTAGTRLLRESAPLGFAPDWAMYRSGQGFLPDPESRGRGSYDAIRVYLWLGMLAPRDPLRAPLLTHYAPMARLVAGNLAPPETLDTVSGEARGSGPVGYSAALIPFLKAQDMAQMARCQRNRVDYLSGDSVVKDGRLPYYDQVLVLFGTGWQEDRYAFAQDGRLIPAWKTRCV